MHTLGSGSANLTHGATDDHAAIGDQVEVAMVQLSADQLAANAATIRRFKPHSLLADDLDEMSDGCGDASRAPSLSQPELLAAHRHLAIVR